MIFCCFWVALPLLGDHCPLFFSLSLFLSLSLCLSYEWKNEAEWIQYIVGMYNLPWDMVCSARAACSLSYSCDIWWWLWSVRLIILSVNEFCTNTHPPPPCPILFRYYSCLYLVNTKISMRKLLSFCLLLCLQLDWNAKQLIRLRKLENRPDKQFIRHKLSATKVRTHLTLISECCCFCFVSLVRCQFRLFLHFNLFVRAKLHGFFSRHSFRLKSIKNELFTQEIHSLSHKN